MDDLFGGSATPAQKTQTATAKKAPAKSEAARVAELPKKRTQGGVSTTAAILSAHVADNSYIFPQVLELHVPQGSHVADITYGTGVFWSRVDLTKYHLHPSDLKTGVDFADLPYHDESMDAVVLDPPYMEGLYRKSADHLAGGGTHTAFRNYYSNGKETAEGPKWHDAVLNAYLVAEIEASRILKPGGVFIVKCQDEVSANRQKLTHVELIYAYESRGYYCRDLFVCVRNNAPVVSRMKQQSHARKNHSYFLVFEKSERKPKYSNFRPILTEI